MMAQTSLSATGRQRALASMADRPTAAGITLTEVVVAAAIMAAVLVAIIPAHNTIIAAINSSGTQARLNAVIDSDLARIKQIAQAFNACSSTANGALGSLSSTGCGVYGEANSYYYFPDPSRASGSGTDVATFETACQASTAASHITKKFIDLAKATSTTELSREGVSKTVERESDTDAANNNVIVRYTGSGGVKRTAFISPYLTYWCP